MSIFAKRMFWFFAPILLIALGYAAFTRFGPTIHIPQTGALPETVSGEPVPFLKVPEGFVATYYAKGVKGARVMEWDGAGRMLVSQTSEGKISMLSDEDNDGTAETVRTLLDGLNAPHGLALWCVETPCKLYVATYDALLRYPYNSEQGSVGEPETLFEIEALVGDRHRTRSILFLGHPYENTLLVSVGSSCNVCHEEDEMRGRILAYDIQSGELTEYARGLRNAVFMTLNPVNDFVFMTEMGRDGLGDTTPPDEVNYIDPAERAQTDTASHFGWPTCYGQNIHDTDFDKNTYIRNPCMQPFEIPAWLGLDAHVAPLGLAFIPEEGWPEDWYFDLLIAEHGSWNSTVPVGYKIQKVNIDEKGQSSNPEDFITGWLTPEGEKLGRPADIKALPGGIIYISDDHAGVIYKVHHASP